MEATVHCVWSKLKETIKYWVEDTLCFDKKMQGLRRELTKKIDERQVDLHAIRTHINVQVKSSLATITDKREHHSFVCQMT
jgi:hypothetical protein